jgi:tetratricopeptide (TPR) repeat protein
VPGVAARGYPAPIDDRWAGGDLAGGRADPRPGPLPRAARPVLQRDGPQLSGLSQRAAGVQTLPELAALLRELRRRHARQQPSGGATTRGGAGFTYRGLAAAAGWSHGIIGEYLSGRVLPPTGRFDTLIALLGASSAEQGALATARDRVEENRRQASGPRAAAGGGAGQSCPPVPHQLPMDVRGFTGRARQLADLDALLDCEGPRPAALICAVAGTAGVGKTALAVHWAHRIAGRFPDGQLYADLRGYDPQRPLAPAEALARFLRGMGVDGDQIPADEAELAARYRTMLAGRRMLVVLDNAHRADQVRPLLPGSPSCFVLVTSRDDLAGLVARDGAGRVSLDPLPAGEAVTLLRALIGPRVDAEPEAAAALAERCARLPLALRIAAELAAARPDMTVADLLDGLQDEQDRLDLLEVAEDPRTAVRSVFSWSCQHLTRDAAHAFSLLGLHPGPDTDDYALAALAGVPLRRARALLGELARAHLVAPACQGRYSMHDLLRAYAAERAAETLGPAERDTARNGLFGYFLSTAAAAMDTLFPHERSLRPHPPPAAAPAPPVTEPAAAARWLDQQRPALTAAAVFAAGHGWPEHSVGLSRVLWRALEVGGHYTEALAIHSAAAEAATADGARASVLANLGSIHWWLGNHRTAQEYFEQSLAGHREAGEADGEARALGRLGLVCERLGDYPAALARMREALAICRRTGNRYGEGSHLINLGTLHRRLGHYTEAAEHQRAAAAVFTELGEIRLEGYALGNLGATDSLLGRHPEALAHLHRALANCRRAADRGGEGSALGTIGAVYRRLRSYPEALDYLHRALAISRETGDRSLETETLSALGDTLHDMGEARTALAQYRGALALASQAGDRFEQARALDGAARALATAGQRGQARAHWQQALAIFSDLGVPEAAQVRARLGG